MQLQIAILEDDEQRRARMLDCLRDRFIQFEVRFFHLAAEMLTCLRSALNQTIAISLDHDLAMLAGNDGRTCDPGTGREVAEYLATQAPVCGVVIHSTNAPAAVGMESALSDRGWTVRRVTPYDDIAWIGETWFPAMRRLIVDYPMIHGSAEVSASPS